MRSNAKGSSAYLKSFMRKGRALLGLERHREAAAVFVEALKLDPLNPELRLGLQEAEQAALADLVEGESGFLDTG